MGLDDFTGWMRGEWAAIAQAPVSFVVAVMVAGFVIWKFVQWQYGAIIGHKDAEIAAHKSKLDSGQASSSVIATTLEIAKPPDATPHRAVKPASGYAQTSTPNSGVELSVVGAELGVIAKLLGPNASISEQKEAQRFLGATINGSGTVSRIFVNTSTIAATLEGYTQPNIQIHFDVNDNSALQLVSGQLISFTGRIGVLNSNSIAILNPVINT